MPYDPDEPFAMSTFSLVRCHGLMCSQKDFASIADSLNSIR